jgi:hypothetical protein
LSRRIAANIAELPAYRRPLERTLASLSGAAAEMNDPTHKKQMEVIADIWETPASHLSKGIDKA